MIHGTRYSPSTCSCRTVSCTSSSSRASLRSSAGSYHSNHLYLLHRANQTCSVEELAKKKGVSMAKVSMAWVLSKPGVSAPIIGTTNLKNLEDALGALLSLFSIRDVCADIETSDCRRARGEADGGGDQVPRGAVPAYEHHRPLLSLS